ncbi:TetR family transcriptional regulator [Rhizocola hellebori]|uniref:TetR family transcriptional regulator n=1 Tax=Rhizocola hellebori TaxID=1392758 RepID=A0A8J3VE59_9ACTN|nr:TetR/AcrR family transcriptional regulator [Rhizocola hellebori]GIH03027.1 TetR family transcriptional regulator [Rhizocola hellebori]
MTARPALDPPAPAKRPKDRKAQIALAAAELFCERGYHSVGIDDIAAVVGISGPAIYNHFPNKYAMLRHATRELSDALLAATVAPQEDSTPRDRLDAILADLVQLGVQRRKVGGLYQWEGRYLGPEDQAQLRHDARTVINRLAVPLRAIRPELDTHQARLLARGVLSLVGSLSTHRAVIAPARAQELLGAAGWRLLNAKLAEVPTAAGRRPAVEAGLRSRRETIMAEALRLFHLNGYHAVTMEDIAAASGTRASSLYRHFSSKSELLAAVYYRAADRVAATTAAALTAATDPADALARLVDSYVDLVFGQSDLVAVYQAENTNLPEDDRHELRRAQRSHVEEWVRVLSMQQPDLGTADCRVLAHGALNLIADLGRAVRFDERGGADRVIAALALDLLG